MFDMKGSVTLTPSERSLPPLAPLVEAGTSYFAIEQGLPITPLSELILHRHILPLGLCADVLRTPLHICLTAAACGGIEQYVKKNTSFLLTSLRSRCLASSGSYSLTSVIQQRSQAPQRIPEYVCLAM